MFSICTHDPDTGVLTDTDAPPAYRIYEDETATAILTGTMDKLDDGNTTGFYTELIACTTANTFESGKTYTVYIEATVDSDKGGICYGFKVQSQTGIKKNQALANFEFYMVLAADHITAATSKVVACQRSIDGGAFANCATATATEVSNGIYSISLAAADLNGDVVTLKMSEATCDTRVITIKTVP